jgi:hypothetical protein
MGLWKTKPSVLETEIAAIQAEPVDTMAKPDKETYLECVKLNGDDKPLTPALQQGLREIMARRNLTVENYRADVKAWKLHESQFDTDFEANHARLEKSWKVALAAAEKAQAELQKAKESARSSELALRDHSFGQIATRKLRGGCPRIWGVAPDCFDPRFIARAERGN